mgnify:CR=1 FL=1
MDRTEDDWISYANAVNDRGQVLGARVDLSQNYNTGLLWETRGRS